MSTATACKSYKVGVKTTDGDADWSSNGVRYATEDEAKKAGDDLFMRWTAVRSWAVLPSDDEPNR